MNHKLSNLFCHLFNLLEVGIIGQYACYNGKGWICVQLKTCDLFQRVHVLVLQMRNTGEKGNAVTL